MRAANFARASGADAGFARNRPFAAASGAASVAKPHFGPAKQRKPSPFEKPLPSQATIRKSAAP
ncbi:hypothetical protein WS69_21870 [Burkholderia sp. BDU5]|nr:hypothetical protein WS69_21870 [Burkholderia sp. BDU5]